MATKTYLFKAPYIDSQLKAAKQKGLAKKPVKVKIIKNSRGTFALGVEIKVYH